MIEVMTGLPENVLGFEASGRVSAWDYESVLMPAVDAAADRNGKLRLLYRVGPGFEKFELGALWDDARVGLSHLGGWQKVAVVCDLDWMRNAVKMFGFAMPGEVKTFGNGELEQAKAWLAT